MHSTIQIAVAAAYTDKLLEGLEQLEEVIGLSVDRGASLKPRGDVVTVHALNLGVDDVLKLARKGEKHGPVSIVIAEVSTIIDPEHQEKIENDVDEAIWEEIETSLRHQARITPNYLALMALGGAVAAAGIVSEGVTQAIAFIAASIIAPGFEPIAKLPLGIVLRKGAVFRRGVISILIGYCVLVASALGAALLLRSLGEVDVKKFVSNVEVQHIAHPGPIEFLVSSAAAMAGVVMIASYRRSVIAGPLLALVLIPAAALIGVGLSVGLPGLALDGLIRLGLDIVLIVGLGAGVLAAKQFGFHRRKPRV